MGADRQVKPGGRLLTLPRHEPIPSSTVTDPTTYALLTDRYREAMTQLAADNLQHASDQVDADDEVHRALTRHVLDLYAHGAAGLKSGALIDRFVAHAPVSMRAQLIEMAGTGRESGVQADPAATDRKRQRLVRT